jgi:hypothetical protein
MPPAEVVGGGEASATAVGGSVRGRRAHVEATGMVYVSASQRWRAERVTRACPASTSPFGDAGRGGRTSWCRRGGPL